MTHHAWTRRIVAAVVVAAGLSTAGQSQEPGAKAASIVDAASLDAFHLPPKTVFDRATPRYPNVWFYVDTALADSQSAAMKLVAEQVRAAMRVRESHDLS